MNEEEISSIAAQNRVRSRAIKFFGLVLLICIAYFVVESRNQSEPKNAGNAAVVTNTAPMINPASIGKIITDKASKREYVSNQVIVEFLTTVSADEANRIIDGVGGVMLQRFTAVPLFLIQVKDEGDGKGAKAAIEALRKNAEVKTADFNFMTTLDEGGESKTPSSTPQ